MTLHSLLRRCLAALALCLVGGVHAQTLRISTAFDPQTMDPHSVALLYH